MLVFSDNNNDFIGRKYKIYTNMWDYSYLHLLVLVSSSLKCLVEYNGCSNSWQKDTSRLKNSRGFKFCFRWHIIKKKKRWIFLFGLGFFFCLFSFWVVGGFFPFFRCLFCLVWFFGLVGFWFCFSCFYFFGDFF